jgi:hypothetical protein
LIAADASKAVGKGNHDRRHEMLADKAIKTLRHILLESGPVGVGQATAGCADQVDKQRQPVTVMSSGDVDIDGARRGIAEDVSLEGFALDEETVDGAHRSEKFSHSPSSSRDWIIPHQCAVPKASAASPRWHLRRQGSQLRGSPVTRGFPEQRSGDVAPISR